uniref:Uncharacterized protein n=1 Tax=Ascaris lumbricoides TaxID=6252 RepID=A0A9J2PWE4_ASCLU
MAHLTRHVILLVFVVVAADAMTFDFAPFSRNCRNKGSCSMLVNALRDPRHLFAYNTDTWNKAIDQLFAYQQLFSEDEVEMVNRLKDEDNPEWIDDTLPVLR